MSGLVLVNQGFDVVLGQLCHTDCDNFFFFVVGRYSRDMRDVSLLAIT